MTSVRKEKRKKRQNDYSNLKEGEKDAEKTGVKEGGGGLRRSQGQEIVWERSRVKVELTCLSIGVH